MGKKEINIINEKELLSEKNRLRYLFGGITGLLILFLVVEFIIGNIPFFSITIELFIILFIFTLNALFFNKKWINILISILIIIFLLIIFVLPYISLAYNKLSIKENYVSVSYPNSYTKEYLVYENIDFNATMSYHRLDISDPQFRNMLASNKLYTQRSYIKPILISNSIDYKSRCPSVHVMGDLYQTVIDCKNNKPSNQDYNIAITDLCFINESNRLYIVKDRYYVIDHMIVKEINAIESSCGHYEIQ